MKHVILFFIIIASAIIARAQSEYIVYSAKGDVAVSNNSGGWDKVGHLDRLSSSSNIRIGQGGELKIYSKKSPQILRINTTGEHRLRRAAKEAAKEATNRRTRVIAPIASGSAHDKTIPSGVGYRSPADDGAIATIASAVTNPSKSDDYCISATNIGDGLKGIILTNNGKAAVAAAAIVVDNGRYTPLNISGDFAKPGVIELPATSSYTVPECQLVLSEGAKIIMVISDRLFDTDALCLLLNKARPTATATDIMALAIEADI